jgi:hypothetical protein
MTVEQEKLIDPNANDSAFEYVFDETRRDWVKVDTGRLVSNEIKEGSGDHTFEKHGHTYAISKDPYLDKDGNPILMATDIVDFMDQVKDIIVKTCITA